MTSSESAHILIVDDIGYTRHSVSKMITELGYSVTSTHSAEEGYQILKTQNIDLVISDIRMPDMDGIEFYIKAQKIQKGTDAGVIGPPPFLLMTADTNPDTIARATSVGIYSILSKPFNLDQLHGMISKALEDCAPRQKTVDQQLQNINALPISNALSERVKAVLKRNPTITLEDLLTSALERELLQRENT